MKDNIIVKLDTKEMKALIDKILRFGNENNIEPHYFVVALLETSYIICDVEQIDLYNLFNLLLKDNENSRNLH